jgi:integrase
MKQAGSSSTDQGGGSGRAHRVPRSGEAGAPAQANFHRSEFAHFSSIIALFAAAENLRLRWQLRRDFISSRKRPLALSNKKRRLGWQHMVSADEIAVRQEKTNEPLTIAMHPELLEALALAPKNNLTFLVTEKGAPFTAAGFGNWFRDQCSAAGLPQCSAHGLRKTHAVRRADAGASAEHLKASTGHKSPSEVARYTRGADQRKLSRQALELQLRAEGREQNASQKLSNLATRLDKTGGN